MDLENSQDDEIEKAMSTLGLSLLGIVLTVTIVGIIFVPLVLLVIEKIWQNN